MNVLLLGAVVWFAVAVLLAVGVGRVLARADVDLLGTDEPIPYDLAGADVSREEWQAHCDEALGVGNDLAPDFALWSAELGGRRSR